ncbi:unnamed protein product [Calypogeia fissa]
MHVWEMENMPKARSRIFRKIKAGNGKISRLNPRAIDNFGGWFKGMKNLGISSLAKAQGWLVKLVENLGVSSPRMVFRRQADSIEGTQEGEPSVGGGGDGVRKLCRPSRTSSGGMESPSTLKPGMLTFTAKGKRGQAACLTAGAMKDEGETTTSVAA